MTSTSVYPYTQGPTPTQWAGISSNGPPGAPFACTPSPTSTIFNTYEWVATGNGCPIGYDYASADTTCIWDDSLTSPVTFIWECLFTVGANANTTVDGGTTTVADGNAITVTANPVTITVTQTVQQSDTVTSIVAPGADTISVTSTVTQNGALVRKHQPQVAELEEKQTVILHNIYPTTDVEYSYFNSSNLLIPRQCVIQCSVYCCDGQGTCVGDGTYCCPGSYFCVPFDPNAPFLDYGASYITFESVIGTTTTTDYETITTYETVTVASGTVTLTPTSTQEITVTNIQTVSVAITTTAGTVTVTVFTTVIVSSPPTTSPPMGFTTSNTFPAPITGPVTIGSTAASLTHSPIPSWTGSGNLLIGYCITPNYVLLTGPTVYWAPFIGCDQNKQDCCPFAVKTGTANYPVPQSANQVTLDQCPDDYQTVSSGCCPSGYSLWNAQLGGQVPCFSTLGTYLTAPPIPSALITAISTSSNQPPIEAVVNVVYAIYYPANPPPSGLSTGAQAGIGAGVGVSGLAVIALGLCFLLRRRRRKSPKSDTHSSGSTLGSAGPQSPAARMEQTQTAPYIAAQHQGPEHYPYANNNPAMYPGGNMPQESAAVPLGGYLPQGTAGYAPQPAYQNWPPVQNQHWQTAQGLQVSPPTSSASSPPDGRYGGGYSSPGSYTGLRPGQASEMHAGQLERWELGGRS